MQLTDSKIKVLHLSENESYIFPEKVYELSDNEILAIRNAPFAPFRTTLIFSNYNNLPNVKYLWRIDEIEGDKFYWILEIQDKICYAHNILSIVLEWSKDRYCIGPFCEPGKEKEARISIYKYPIGTPKYSNLVSYNSIKELKSNSAVFRGLSLQEKTWVCETKNITTVSTEIFSLKFDDYSFTARFLKHLLLGDIRKGHYTGIHHIFQVLRGNAKLNEMTDPPNMNGVWRGKLQLKDLRFNESVKNAIWKNKVELSTFFPNHWNNIELVEECKFAWDNKTNKIALNNSNKWDSETKTGISVVILNDKLDNIKTMYPDWEKEKLKYN